MLEGKRICFLGAGNMAGSLIKGLVRSGRVSPGQIIASDRLKDRLLRLAEEYEIKIYSKNYEACRDADIVFITVKPVDVPSLLGEVSEEMDTQKLVISTVAGTTTSTILGLIGRAVPLVRAMPNISATVLEGMTAIFPGPGAGRKGVDTARAIFDTVGRVVVVEDESLMDLVTGLSGSGPAYVFMFMEGLFEAGLEGGLPEEISRLLSLQTTLGAVRLAMESKKDFKELIDMVTSPGGTTIEGLKRLDGGGFKQVVKEAVRAATARAKELSGTN